MKRIAFILFTVFIITISVLAYLDVLPTSIDRIPHYDSIGHFLLYGIWGYLFAQVLPKPLLSLSGLVLPIGILVAGIVAMVEEYVQSFSAVRTFSLRDLACGLFGIMIATIVFNIQKRQAINRNN